MEPDIRIEAGAEGALEQEAPKSVLHDKGFVGLLVGSTLSRLGDACFMVALPWLVLQATGSPVALGLVMTAFTIPRALLMLVGGAFGDRYDSRKILFVVSLFQSLSVFLIALVASQETVGIPSILVVIVFFGLADAFLPSATKVLLIELLDRERLRDGSAILQTSGQLCWLAGPALAGLLVTQFSLHEVFVFDALSFLPYAVIVLLLPTTRRAAGAAAGVAKAILEGLRYVRAERKLLVLVGAVAAVNFCVPAVTELGLAAISVSRYGSAAVFGGLVTCVGIGAIVGVWFAKTAGKGFSVHVALAGTVAGLSLCVGSLMGELPVWGFYAQGVVLGALAGYINLHVTIWLQLNSRPDMLGRVMSVVGFSSAAVAPISLMAGGLLAGADLNWLFLASSVALAVVAASVATSGRWDVRWD